MTECNDITFLGLKIPPDGEGAFSLRLATSPSHISVLILTPQWEGNEGQWNVHIYIRCGGPLLHVFVSRDSLEACEKHIRAKIRETQAACGLLLAEDTK